MADCDLAAWKLLNPGAFWGYQACYSEKPKRIHFSASFLVPRWNVKARFLFLTGSQPDLSHVKRKVHEAGSILAFPLPAELSLADSRNKRLVHQGSPCPKHSYHRNPFPFRICTTLVLTQLNPRHPRSLWFFSFSLSTTLCPLISIYRSFFIWSVSYAFSLSLSLSLAPIFCCSLREEHRFSRAESFIIAQRVSLPDTRYKKLHTYVCRHL